MNRDKDHKPGIRSDISDGNAFNKIENARRSMIPVGKRIRVIEDGKANGLTVVRYGVGQLTTVHGRFYHFLFEINDIWKQYSVLAKVKLNEDFSPIIDQSKQLFIRIDSGCQTGQVFGDLTCECRQQLDMAMEKINVIGEGLIINIPRQDGRGKHLPFKLATLMLQNELHFDTVEASKKLAPDEDIDSRTYGGVIGILKFFCIEKLQRIDLATNNPKKVKIFFENGYVNTKLSPIIVPPSEYTERHLRAKEKELGHINLISG